MVSLISDVANVLLVYIMGQLTKHWLFVSSFFQQKKFYNTNMNIIPIYPYPKSGVNAFHLTIFMIHIRKADHH